MEIEKLNKEDFIDPMRGQPSVRFTHKGVVCFNKAAVKHLGLHDKKSGKYAIVNICREKDDPSNFGVFKDTEGWQLRNAFADGAIFNNVGLARFIIDTTWDRKGSCHGVGAVKPQSMVFRIARLPMDDGKNKDVFALLRKKE